MTPRDPSPHDRPTLRARAFGIATVLAGLMHLVLAAILLGIPSSTPTLDPFDTPNSDATTPKHTPPGQTREPPGQAARKTPPGQPKQPPGQAANQAHEPKDHPPGNAGHPGEPLDSPNGAQRGKAMSDFSGEGLSAAAPSPRCDRGCR